MDKVARILIVDDEPFNVDYLEQELEDLHYETLTAGNGREALEKISSKLPDLVLLDIMMPIMDGFSVLQAVKANAETRNIPIIVISANNDLQNVVKGIALGAEDYLPKPFEPTILQARISSCLEKKRLRDREQLYLQSLERELDIAREIQTEFLPYEMPKVAGWEIASYFKAAKEVAGDFYDAFTLPNGNLICVIGDVCGKGVGAALYMTLFRSLIRITTNSVETRSSKSPSDVLQYAVTSTNNYVARTHENSNMFATIFICLLDVTSGTLFYVNGGNERPYLLRSNGALEELQTCGPALGAVENAKFTVRETNLTAGDLLLTFTDGIPDCQNPQGEFFGRERVEILLKQKTHQAEACLQEIGDQLLEFFGASEQFDDITMLAVGKLQ